MELPLNWMNQGSCQASMSDEPEWADAAEIGQQRGRFSRNA
jgi:hypothetical protein